MNKKIKCPKCHKNSDEVNQDADLSTLEFVGDGTDNVQCWFACECGATWKVIFVPE